MSNECSIPNSDIGFLIWRISKFWQRGKHRSLDEFGLTGPQLEILAALYHLSLHKSDVTQIDLSQEADVDPMTTSTILRNLQRKGLVDRKESQIDTRARNIELTNEGLLLFEKAIAKIKLTQEKLFVNLDKEALRTQLQLLLAELDKFSKKESVINN